MVAATLFTLTTRFTYNGLGARVAVEVVGYDTTTVTLDLAAGNRILAEETLTGATRHLYGRDCLGEFRAGDWLYYLPDAEGLVRQGADVQGDLAIRSRRRATGRPCWPGESSRLRRGVRLVHGAALQRRALLRPPLRSGCCANPSLGIWLALLPLIVVRRKKKRRGFPWVVVLALCLGGMSGVLTACGGTRQKAMDDFADQFCIDTATLPLPHKSLEEKTLGYPDVNGEEDKCEVIDVCVRETGTLLEGIEGPSKGLPAFAKDVIIVFCLGKDTKAEDCEVLSWIQGYLRKKASGETAWDYGNNFFGYSPHVEQDHPGAGLDKTGAESGFPYPTDCNCPYKQYLRQF